MAITDSFSLNGFINCFSHHIRYKVQYDGHTIQDENEHFNVLAYLTSNLSLYQNIGNSKKNSC